MTAADLLPSLLLPGRQLRREAGYTSMLAPGATGARYDGRARLYDALVGSRLYNRLFWGAETSDYAAFAERAVMSGSGPYLDAGCGTLHLCAGAYLKRPDRPIFVLDLSRDMLLRARQRVASLNGGAVPPHICFVHADLLDLPFLPGIFATVLCAGMLHLFEDVHALVRDLHTVTAPEGSLFLTSLVRTGRAGDHYLSFLNDRGEVATPRTVDELREITGSALGDAPAIEVRGSMVYLVATVPAPVMNHL